MCVYGLKRSLQSKIKVRQVIVGLSPTLDLWKGATSSQVERLSAFPRSKNTSQYYHHNHLHLPTDRYLVDCSTHKGSLHLGLNWVASNGGVCLETSYPWAAGKSTCNLAKCTKSVTCSGTVHLPHDGAKWTSYFSRVYRRPLAMVVLSVLAPCVPECAP